MNFGDLDAIGIACLVLGLFSLAGLASGAVELISRRGSEAASLPPAARPARKPPARPRQAINKTMKRRAPKEPEGAALPLRPAVPPSARPTPSPPMEEQTGSLFSRVRRALQQQAANRSAQRGRPAQKGSESLIDRWRRRSPREDLLPIITGLIHDGPLRFLRSIESDLIRIRSPLRLSEIVAGAIALSALTVILVKLLSDNIVLALFGGAALLYIPFAAVRVMARQWLNRFEQLLAETLLLMANAMRSGYGIMQAMAIVAEEGSPPLSEEFQRALQAIQLGATVEEAFQTMCDRVKSPDLELAVTAILITRQLGGSLSEVLTTISSTIRQRITVRRELSTLTSEGRLSAIGLTVLPILLIFLLNGASLAGGAKEPYTRVLFTDPWGRALLAYWGISLTIGYTIMRRIIDIDL